MTFFRRESEAIESVLALALRTVRAAHLKEISRDHVNLGLSFALIDFVLAARFFL